jgi:hypothetical protein
MSVTRVCAISSCDSSFEVVRGMCNKHYLRARRRGFASQVELSYRDKNEYIILDGYAEVFVTDMFANRTGSFLIDAADLWILDKTKWRVSNNRYVMSDRYRQLHRYLLHPPLALEVDHINGNRLDNRRCNLRIVNRSENLFNKPLMPGKQIGYKGVYRDRKNFEIKLMIDGVNVRVGRIKSADEAAYIYDQFAAQLQGKFARLNLLDISDFI